ncbi:hypothetical protein CFC21_092371, partial [Triticum aestivum]
TPPPRPSPSPALPV